MYGGLKALLAPMTIPEHSFPTPPLPPEAVFDALDKNPLMPLTLGILSTADPSKMTLSEIQRFILDAAGADTEDEPEPTHDTAEILSACQDMQQKGLVMIGQTQPDAEPHVELTTVGEQVGIPVARIIMDRYIAQGHGINTVQRSAPRQGHGIVGMIALGAAGLVTKVAEALDDGAQYIDEQTRMLIKNAIRNRPLPRPPIPSAAKPTLGAAGRTQPPSPNTGGHTPLPKPPKPQSKPNSQPPETSKFTTKIIQPPLKVKIYGIGLSVPSELDKEAYPRSDVRDRPAPAPTNPSTNPDNPESATPATDEHDAPELDESTAPNAASPAGNQDPQNSKPTSPRSSQTKPANNPESSSEHPAPATAYARNEGTVDNEEGEGPEDQDKQDKETTKDPGKQPQAKDGSGGGNSGRDSTPNPPAKDPVGNNGGGGSGRGLTNNSQPSIEEVKAALNAAADNAEAIVPIFQQARHSIEELNADIAAIRTLAEAARAEMYAKMLAAQMRGGFGPTAPSQNDITNLEREISKLDEAATHFALAQNKANELTTTASNPENNLADAIRGISNRL